MLHNRTRWVVLGVNDEVREAIVMYANLRGMYTGDVVNELGQELVERMAGIRSGMRETATAIVGEQP
jgi:hypothetical protein